MTVLEIVVWVYTGFVLASIVWLFVFIWRKDEQFEDRGWTAAFFMGLQLFILYVIWQAYLGHSL